MAETNPYGANGTTSDPREQTCWDNYVKSILENRINAYQSAIDAGYEEDTARNITMNDWFKDRLGRLKRKDMLSKAERNLDKALDTEYENDGKIMPDIMRIVIDVSKNIAGTLGKEHYSERQEVTGKDGEALNKPIDSEEFSAILSQYAINRRKENSGTQESI